MSNVVQNFTVAASLFSEKFTGVILKFKLSNGDILLSSWNIDGCMHLIQTVTKHITYLEENKIDYDSDNVEASMDEASDPTHAEVESAAKDHIVKTVTGLMDAAGNMTMSIMFDEQVNIVLPPDYAEWLYGYVVNIVEEYNVDGTPKSAGTAESKEVTH